MNIYCIIYLLGEEVREVDEKGGRDGAAGVVKGGEERGERVKC